MYATTAGEKDGSLDQEVRLYGTNKEREKYENMADLYSIIVATEHLERAYVRDAITAQEYTPACNKLIGQFKTALNLLRDEVPDVERFMQEFRLSCTAAVRRLVEIGVPATVEHTAAETSTVSKRNVAEVTQIFITLMDALKLNMVEVDQIHPQLSGLMQTLGKFPLSEGMEGKAKIKEWLVTLNKMKAFDSLTSDQVRQLEFDISR
ncbi:vacuolar protein sorting-associated [Cladochytrium replicatum]|nr:vacuolar protein sorting-associated [Cladochytrium replicatum]